MYKLIQYTGGSIFLTIGVVFFMLVGLVVGIVILFTSIAKNKAFPQKEKINYYVQIISAIIIAMVLGGIIVRYWCMYRIL